MVYEENNVNKEFYDRKYYEAGIETGKSLYQNYRWIPEMTIPLAHHIIRKCNLYPEQSVLDFGCAKGYLVKALRLLGMEAYGVDVSEYAISEADEDVEYYVSKIEPLADLSITVRTIICKDVLEHIPYESIDEQLKILFNHGSQLFAIIPIAENGKYIIDSYELDKSHLIREDEDWWKHKIYNAGYFNVRTTTNLKYFKANWDDIDHNGNILVIADK